MSKHKPNTGGPPQGSARDRMQAKIAAEAQRQRQQRLFLVIAVVVVLALIGGGIGLQLWRTRKAPDAGPGAGTSASANPLTALNAAQTPVNGKPLVLGDAGAPVTVALYEDFHCPHCAEFEERFGSVITDAQLAGRVKVELYPMSFIDAGSARAANGMACAAEAGFGQTYYLGLFANPTLSWNTDQLVQLASTTGSTASADFSSCVSTGRYDAWAQSINTAANANGVSSTPTMFINGKAVDVGALTTPDSLKTQLDAAGGS